MKTFKQVALVLLVLGAAVQAFAFNPQPDPPGFGMIGIIHGQTARLNAVLVEPDGPDRVASAGYRHVSLLFVDGDGSVLRQSEVRLFPGRAVHIDYRYQEPDGPDREIPIDIGARQHVRAIIRFIDDPNIRNSAAVLATLEVFNTESGETAFVLPGTNSCFGEVEGMPAP